MLLPLSHMVTLVHSLLLRLHLVLAEIATHWHSNREENYNMVPVYAPAIEPSVLTLLLKQTQLFMNAKLNQTVGMAERNICF